MTVRPATQVVRVATTVTVAIVVVMFRAMTDVMTVRQVLIPVQVIPV